MSSARLAASSIALAAVLVATSLAVAQEPPPPPAEQVGEWAVRAIGHGSCAAERRFDDGTRVHLFAHEGGHRTLSLSNRGWTVTGRPTYRLVLLRGVERRPLVPEDPRSVGSGGLYMPLSEAQFGEVAAAEAVEVLGRDGALLKRVELAGLGAAAARMPACLTLALAHPWPAVAPPPSPPPPSGLVRPRRALPRMPLHSLITAADYPAAALAAEQQGRVGYRLDVDEDGRVTGCLIVSSSGSPVLDDATCQLLTRRARFEPARDVKGRRTADSVTGRVVWALEDPAPEPEPTPQ